MAFIGPYAFSEFQGSLSINATGWTKLESVGCVRPRAVQDHLACRIVLYCGLRLTSSLHNLLGCVKLVWAISSTAGGYSLLMTTRAKLTFSIACNVCIS